MKAIRYHLNRVILLGLIGFYPNLTYSSDLSRLKQEIGKEVNKLRAAYSEDAKLLRQQDTTLSKELQNFSEIVQVLLSQNSELKNRMTQIEEENSKLKHDFTNRIKKLELRIDEEQSNRRDADRNIVDEVSSEIGKMVSQSKNAQASLSSQSSNSDGFSIYEVVRGDTLGAISKAFEVSLKQLIAYNDLSGTTIYVGQRIKIPGI